MNAFGSRFLVTNLTFVNGASHQLEMATNFTEVANVNLTSPGTSPNTDGIDVHGTPFYVHDSYISVGDDHVAVHANDTLVERCSFGTGHGASIGSLGGHVAVTNVTFQHIKIDGAGGGIHVKSWIGATGELSQVYYRNISMTNVGMAINLEMNYEVSFVAVLFRFCFY
jgi:polygalacturonase